MKNNNRHPQKDSKEDLYSLVFDINFKNADDFERSLKSKNKIQALILLLSATILGWGFFFYFGKQMYMLLSCLILTYGIIWMSLYYCHQIIALRNWRVKGHSNHQTPVQKSLRWILDKSLLVPAFYALKLIKYVAKKTNTHNVYKYAIESLSSISIATVTTLYLSAALILIVNKYPSLILWCKHISPLFTDVAFIHYCSLIIWLVYKVIRNRLLYRSVKKSSKSKELGNDGCLRTYKRIKYELDTYGLILVLVITLMLTPLKFSSDEALNIIFGTIEYICLIYTAYLTCLGHFN